ncbi:GNAT family N-acetyltransferase [Peptoniphilus equinus]|uniref:GNAT family N-acetyltransferase n=1 Tax=Peptoniphilus equinus TaxID=3016343 RepID=A0ABY7QT00_9FIRM|nr:GNAT family N-acetyltransferase [Peptoniphilus equinus]WBW49899.1 GNAT family N-acetyltransferase [Peptoniphilus equinus]
MQYNTTIELKDGRACVLRHGTPSDAAGVMATLKKVREETDFLLSYEEGGLTLDGERDLLARQEASPSALQLCAVVDGNIVGTAGVSAIGSNEKIKHRAELGVSVEQAYWNLGIGRALAEACIEAAKHAGYRQLELEVVADNVRAVALYEKLGFETHGRNPRGFYSQQAGWQELVSMGLTWD